MLETSRRVTSSRIIRVVLPSQVGCSIVNLNMENLVQLDGVTNFRDVGKTVNEFLGRKLVEP